MKQRDLYSFEPFSTTDVSMSTLSNDSAALKRRSFPKSLSPPPSILTGSFRPMDLLRPVSSDMSNVSASDPADQDWGFAPLKVPDGISLRNFGIQVVSCFFPVSLVTRLTCFSLSMRHCPMSLFILPKATPPMRRSLPGELRLRKGRNVPNEPIALTSAC